MYDCPAEALWNILGGKWGAQIILYIQDKRMRFGELYGSLDGWSKKENNHRFPVVFDENASLIYGYGISSYPSTLIIDKGGYIVKYIPGAMNKQTMKNLIESER